MNFQRTGQFQVFKPLKELVIFMKELVVLSQFLPGSLTFRLVFWIVSGSEYHKNIQFWGYRFQKMGTASYISILV
jgi:hypothetical protein